MRKVQSTLFALLAASGSASAEMTLNLTQGVSPISHDVYELHMTIFWICVAIGILVFGAMFYAMIFHRKSKGAKAAQFHSHSWLEITWTIIPVIILVVMAIPATKVLFNMNNIEKEEVTVKITGYQWKWRYEYIEDGVSFFSNLSTPLDQRQNKAPKSANYLREVDHPLVLPIHKKIRFLITSNDVNHAWWVPDFGVKRDAISGFINEAWTKIDKAGTYRGQCAELCGIDHAFMPIVVVATTEQGFKDWIAEQKGEATKGESETNKLWTMQELMKQGEQVYSRICAACHQPSGLGLPPTFPALKGSKIATGPIPGHVEIVFNGKAGTAMQAFKNQLNDVDIASVITYERNAFGNNTGTLVQPIQIKTLRSGKTIEEALAAQPVAEEAGNALPDQAKEKVEQVTTEQATEEKRAAEVAAPPAAQAEPVSAPVPAPASQSVTTPAAEQSASSAAATDDLKTAMERGEKIYLAKCAVCHQPTGLGVPPVFPALKNSPIATGPLPNHINQILNGKAGTAMVAFRDQLNDQEIADVITYERNAWENNTGNLVTAKEINAARQQVPTSTPQAAATTPSVSSAPATPATPSSSTEQQAIPTAGGNS